MLSIVIMCSCVLHHWWGPWLQIDDSYLYRMTENLDEFGTPKPQGQEERNVFGAPNVWSAPGLGEVGGVVDFHSACGHRQQE